MGKVARERHGEEHSAAGLGHGSGDGPDRREIDTRCVYEVGYFRRQVILGAFEGVTGHLLSRRGKATVVRLYDCGALLLPEVDFMPLL